MLSFQDMIATLQTYWSQQGCITIQPTDLPMGAGTFHPATFLRAIGPEPWRCAYVQPCRRPTDGRYAENPNRLQHYYQFQVIIKPSPPDPLALYLGSLQSLQLLLEQHDLRFVEDNWESPTLGASGLGWEVWLDGMEVSQITYFQEVSSLPCRPISLEITYGLERLAMFIQNVTSVFELIFHKTSTHGPCYYADIFKQSEAEQCAYNFEHANTEHLVRYFEEYIHDAQSLIEKTLPYPAYEFVILCSHVFNLLDARQYFSHTERARYIQKIRELARGAAKAYYQSRFQLGFPLLPNEPSTWTELLTPQQIQEVQEKRSTI